MINLNKKDYAVFGILFATLSLAFINTMQESSSNPKDILTTSNKVQLYKGQDVLNDITIKAKMMNSEYNTEKSAIEPKSEIYIKNHANRYLTNVTVQTYYKDGNQLLAKGTTQTIALKPNEETSIRLHDKLHLEDLKYSNASLMKYLQSDALDISYSMDVNISYGQKSKLYHPALKFEFIPSVKMLKKARLASKITHKLSDMHVSSFPYQIDYMDYPSDLEKFFAWDNTPVYDVEINIINASKDNFMIKNPSYFLYKRFKPIGENEVLIFKSSKEHRLILATYNTIRKHLISSKEIYFSGEVDYGYVSGTFSFKSSYVLQTESSSYLEGYEDKVNITYLIDKNASIRETKKSEWNNGVVF